MELSGPQFLPVVILDSLRDLKFYWQRLRDEKGGSERLACGLRSTQELGSGSK